MMGTCEIRTAPTHDGRPLLLCNDSPGAIESCIRDAPRYAANVFELSDMPVVVRVNGKVIYAYTPLNLTPGRPGITIAARRRRREERDRTRRALELLAKEASC